MQREPTSDLFSSFGPRARLAQFRHLVQDAIDVFEGLVMARPERYRATEDLEINVGGAEGVTVSSTQIRTTREISLPDGHRTAVHT